MKIKSWIDGIVGLIYPDNCVACGARVFNKECICLYCEVNLPKTNFHKNPNNAVAKSFWGRVNVVDATSLFYLSRNSKISKTIHALKYFGRKDVGKFLGKLLAIELDKYQNYESIDCIIPVPLTKNKLIKRGFNQTKIIAEGFTELRPLPIEEEVIIRGKYKQSQTKLGRWERYQNVTDAFKNIDKGKLIGQTVLVIDDVITTGGTLEAVCNELLKTPHIKVLVASIAYAASS